MRGQAGAVGAAGAVVVATCAGAMLLGTPAASAQTQTKSLGAAPPPTVASAFMTNGFNGTVKFMTYPENGKGKGTPMTQYTSGNKLRYDVADTTGQPQGAFIIDGNTGTFTMLMLQQKQYMQFTPQQAQAAAAQVKPVADSLAKQFKVDSTARVAPTAAPTVAATNYNPNIKVTQVGSDVVAGTPCTVYDITGTDQQGKTQSGEVCAAQGVGFTFMGAGAVSAMGMYGGAAMAKNPAAQQEYAAWQQVLGGGKGIVRIASLEGGKKQVNMVATSIDKSAPSDEVFQVPPGYTKFQMPSLKSALAGNGNGSGAGNAAGSAANGVANSAAQGAQQTADSAAHQGAKNAVKKLLHFP